MEGESLVIHYTSYITCNLPIMKCIMCVYICIYRYIVNHSQSTQNALDSRKGEQPAIHLVRKTSYVKL